MNELINELKEAGYHVRFSHNNEFALCGSNIIEYNDGLITVNKKIVPRTSLIAHLQTLCVKIKVV
jgi:hypothetical protein